MRISDWSSDVCSSDLLAAVFAFAVVFDRFLQWSGRIANDLLRGLLRGSFISILLIGPILVGTNLMVKPAGAVDAAGQPLAGCKRSEEHTSELQSLMRISYAVFCLKKKKTISTHTKPASMDRTHA